MLARDLHELMQRKEFPDVRRYFSFFAPAGDKFRDQDVPNHAGICNLENGILVCAPA